MKINRQWFMFSERLLSLSWHQKKFTMVETRTQSLKRRFTPLLNEFYQLKSVSIIENFLVQQELAPRKDYPLYFRQIKEKFERALYKNPEELVDDIRKVMRTTPSNEAEVSRAVRDLELYIERTIEPVVAAEDILDLYQLERGACVQLDENNSLENVQLQQFEASSNEDRLKMSLRWPLPAVPADTNSAVTAGASLSRASTGASSSLSTPARNLGVIQEEPNMEQVRRERTLTIDGGPAYHVGVIPWDETFKFSILIRERNKVDRSEFARTYVGRYLKSLQTEKMQSLKKDHPFGIPGKSQVYVDSVQREVGVELLIQTTLYGPIEDLVLDTLNAYLEDFSKDFNKNIVNKRPYIRVTGAGNNINLLSNFDKEKLMPFFFSLNVQLDLLCHYAAHLLYRNIPRTTPVVYTGIGELKYFTFDLAKCLKYLETPAPIWNTPLPADRETPRESLVRAVEDTLLKSTTSALYLGVSRYFLSDYNCFIFVKLEFTSEDAPSDYGTRSNDPDDDALEYLKAEYTYILHSDPYIRLFFLSFFAINDEFLKETEVFRSRLRNKFNQKEEQLRQLQQAERQLRQLQQEQQLRRLQQEQQLRQLQQEQRLRQLQQEEIGEQSASGANDTAGSSGLQLEQGTDPSTGRRGGRVERYNLRTTSNFHENLNDTTWYTPPSSRVTPTYRHDDIALKRKSGLDGSQVNHNTQSNRFLAFEKTMLMDPSYVRLGKLITELVQSGSYISQIVEINCVKFSQQVFKENMLKQTSLPPFAILKVFDPYRGNYKGIKYCYQTAANYATREIKAYCILSQYRGTLIPNLYGYGRLSDLYPGVGDIYCRLCGPYLVIQKLEDDQAYTITKEFFVNKIIKLFKTIHMAGVIQSDVKRQNSIITPNKEFFIIDFSHCQFTTDKSVQEAELTKVCEVYGKPGWY